MDIAFKHQWTCSFQILFEDDADVVVVAAVPDWLLPDPELVKCAEDDMSELSDGDLDEDAEVADAEAWTYSRLGLPKGHLAWKKEEKKVDFASSDKNEGTHS